MSALLEDAGSPEGRADEERLRQALVTIKRLRAQVEGMAAAGREPIAVIGLGCRLPGGGDGPEAVWRLLRDGVDAVGEIPRDRFDVDLYYDPDPEAPGKMYTRQGAFLDGVDGFDPDFFGIAPREVPSLDPQQRLLLEVSWEALEDAGQPVDRLTGSDTGVFIGLSNLDYFLALSHQGPRAIDAYMGTGTAHSATAARLSFLLNFRGPTLAVDTACSSSLVATHLACQSLRLGECRMALAGGANVNLRPEIFLNCAKARMLSRDGRCKTFDAAADGFGRGEGAGVVVLKRLADARADGDRILALIRGTAVNEDGRSQGFTAPNGRAQQAVARLALQRSGLEPAAIDYVEAHGTGTSLGDTTEAEALGEVFGPDRPAERPLWVGSIKTNIGHLEAASGVASLIKVVLALHHRQLPPHLHLVRPNPLIRWDELPLRVPRELTPWPAGPGPRRAGINSFGFSGINAHLVLEQAPAVVETPAPAPPAPTGGEPPLYLLPLSAKREEALRALAGRYACQLAARPEEQLADVAFSAGRGRSRFAHRCAVLAGDAAAAGERLAAFAAGEAPPEVIWGCAAEGERRRIAFLFSGQGAQYAGMGGELYRTQPVFRDAIDRFDALLQPRLGMPLPAVLAGAGDPERIHRTAFTQPALVALELALVELWRAWGIEAGAVIGHSIGEIVAAACAGVLTAADALALAAERGRLMEALPAGGVMAAVAATPERLRAALRGREGDAATAAVNGPRRCVVSGSEAAVEAVLAELAAEGVAVKRLQVSHAFHSPRMDPVLDALEQAAAVLPHGQPRRTWISNLTGRPLAAGEVDAAYWRRHARQEVRFHAGLQALVDAGYRLFVEVGPHPVLSAFGSQGFPAAGGEWLHSLRRGRGDEAEMLHNLARCFVAGGDVDWRGVAAAGAGGRLVTLPTYPFARERYWLPEGGGPPAARAPSAAAPIHPLLGRRLRTAGSEVLFEAELRPGEPAFLDDHRVHGRAVFPAAGLCELAFAAAAAAGCWPGAACALAELAVEAPLLLAEDAATTVQVVLRPGEAAAAFEVHAWARPAAGGEPCWVRHAAGRLERVDTPAPPAPALAALRAACSRELPVAAHRESMRRRGLAYGPAFQGIQALWAGAAGEVLARVELPGPVGADAARFELHPALLDACLQVPAAALPPERQELAYLPVAIGRLELHRRGACAAWCLGTLDPGASRGGDDATASLLLLDDAGGTIATLAGLRLRRAPPEAIAGQRAAAGESWLYELDWRPVPLPPPAPPAAGGRWLVLADRGGLGEALGERLAGAGGKVLLVHAAGGPPGGDERRPRPEVPADFVRLLDDAAGGDVGGFGTAGGDAAGVRGVIHLWSLDAAPAEDTTAASLDADRDRICGSLLHLVQALAAHGRPAAGSGRPALPRLWVVTAGAQAAGDEAAALAPVQALAWGLGRVAANEHPELACALIDLDPAGGPAPAARGDRAAALLAELAGGDGEGQIAYRGGRRLAARLAPWREGGSGGPAPSPPAGPVELRILGRGLLDDLAAVPALVAEPGPGELRIRMQAAGLNFKDVLNALGMLAGDEPPLGGECAGEVTAVGAGVAGFAAGQRVLAVARRSFASEVVAAAELTAPLPAGLGYEQAATLPIAFCTAHLALHDLGRLAPGERVLVHAASGGVGLAAVQLARRAGAEVLATAGSAEKRAFLLALGVRHVFPSRSPEFAAEVHRATGGRGVDLVLNSLAGELLAPSLACAADGGRFVEIGRLGNRDEVRAAAAERGILYQELAIDQLARDRPALVGEVLRRVLAAVAAGELQPLPLRVFPFAAATAAFRLMQQAGHVGKIVLAAPADGDAAAPHADATYLVTGGLGGLGLVFARHLAERGARSLVLAGRRPPSAAAAHEIAAIAELGVRVEVAQADVADAEQAAALVARIGASLPPLAGILHAAGVLDDGTLAQLDLERFRAVLAPKVAGAWNLAAATSGQPLDFLCFFSSAATVLGSPGQGNYAAANGFLDVLAHDLRRRGRPAVSIGWGPWEGAGMAAGAAAERGFAERGVEKIPPRRGLALFDRLLREPAAHALVLPVDWRRFFAQLPAASRPPLFGELAARLAPAGGAAARPGAPAARDARALVAGLAGEPPASRPGRMLALVSEQAARVLGLKASSRLPPDQPLIELGLDSLMGIELRNALGAAAGVHLPATLIFDHPSLRALAEHLLDVLGLAWRAPLSEAPGPGAPEPASRLEAEVAALTSAEVESFLRTELEDAGY